MTYTRTAWRRSRRTRSGLALVAILLLASFAQADVLTTGQGERLSGELSRIVDGILVFRTSMQGQMMVPASEVQSLTTEAAWAITDREGTVHIGRFVSGGISVKGDGEEARIAPIPIAEVESANRLPSGMEPGAKGAEKNWRAYAATGVRAFEGTEDGVSPEVSLGVRGVDERGEVQVDLRFDATSEDMFPGYFRGRFEVLGAGEQPWQPFMQARAERDRYNALDLRTGLSVGVRYDFDTAESSSFQGLLGLGGAIAEWDRAGVAGGPRPWEEPEASRSELNAHLELRYSRAIQGGATWDNRLYLLPSLTDADHFRAGAESSLVYPVTPRLQLRLDMLMGYENDPVFGSLDRVDTSLGASIQLDF